MELSLSFALYDKLSQKILRQSTRIRAEPIGKLFVAGETNNVDLSLQKGNQPDGYFILVLKNGLTQLLKLGCANTNFEIGKLILINVIITNIINKLEIF